MKLSFFATCALATISSALDLASMENLTMAETYSDLMAPRTCKWVHNQAVKQPPNFYKLVKDKKKYSDPDFGPEESSLSWADLGEGNKMQAQLKKIRMWERAGTVFPKETLFGDSISPADVNQAMLGDCWFLSSCAALAAKPGRIQNLFLNKGNKQNEAGIYGVQFYRLGVPQQVIIDDYLPLYYKRSNVVGTVKNGEYSTIFAKVGGDNGSGLWPALIEKAFAKLHGNYHHLEGGNAKTGIKTLTGAPSEEWRFLVGHAAPAHIFAKLVAQVGKDSIMQCSTPSHPQGDKAQTADGIVFNHQYSLLGAHKLSDGTKLVRIRNPHGMNEWTGKFSDGDTASWAKVPAADKKILEAEGQKDNDLDGEFYMLFADFYRKFRQVTITYDVTDWYSAYFLMIDDDGSKQVENRYSKGDCPDCYKHTVTIKSTVDQTLFVTAFVVDQTRRPKECAGKRAKAMKNIVYDKRIDGNLKINGDRQLWPFEAKAGQEYKIELQFDFQDDVKDVVDSDWSVTAWGAKGDVSISHDAGAITDSWPLVEKSFDPLEHAFQLYRDFEAHLASQ